MRLKMAMCFCVFEAKYPGLHHEKGSVAVNISLFVKPVCVCTYPAMV